MCIVCAEEYTGSSRDALSSADVKLLKGTGLCKHHPRKDCKHIFGHLLCIGKALGRVVCISERRGWNEEAFKTICAMREALQFDDILRFHGPAVAERVRGTLSDSAAKIFASDWLRNQARCRSDDRLDRTSCTLMEAMSSLRSGAGGATEFSNDDLLKIIACVCVANNAQAYAAAEPFLTMSAFDAKRLHDAVASVKFRNGIGGRAYQPLTKYCGDGPRTALYGGCMMLKEVALPALADGALAKLWEVAVAQTEPAMRNKVVAERFVDIFPVPRLVRYVILRHISLATAQDPRGPLCHRSLFREMHDGAVNGMDSIIPPALGDKPIRLASLCEAMAKAGNPSLCELLPLMDMAVCGHLCCEKRKMADRAKRVPRRPPGDAAAHRRAARSFWRLCAPGAPLPYAGDFSPTTGEFDTAVAPTTDVCIKEAPRLYEKIWILCM